MSRHAFCRPHLHRRGEVTAILVISAFCGGFVFGMGSMLACLLGWWWPGRGESDIVVSKPEAK